jgi:hypothetical protein
MNHIPMRSQLVIFQRNVDIADVFRDAGVDFDRLRLLGDVWMLEGDEVTVRDGSDFVRSE